MEVSHRTKSVCYFDLLYIQPLYFTSPSDMIIQCFSVTVSAACFSLSCVHPISLSERGPVDGADSSAGMLWERGLLVHTKLGLILLLCMSATRSQVVTDTSRDVDLCQINKHSERSGVSRCCTCRQRPNSCH